MTGIPCQQECKYGVIALQIRRVCVANSPCLVTKHAVIAARQGTNKKPAGRLCNPERSLEKISVVMNGSQNTMSSPLRFNSL